MPKAILISLLTQLLSCVANPAVASVTFTSAIFDKADLLELESEYVRLTADGSPSATTELNILFFAWFLSDWHQVTQNIHRAKQYLVSATTRCDRFEEDFYQGFRDPKEKSRACLVCSVIYAMGIGNVLLPLNRVSRIKQNLEFVGRNLVDPEDKYFAQGILFAMLPPGFGQHYGKSLVALETLRRLKPELLSIQFWIARIHLVRGNLRKASELFESVWKARPSDIRIAHFWKDGRLLNVQRHSDGLGFGIRPQLFLNSATGLGASLQVFDDRLFDGERAGSLSLWISSRKNLGIKSTLLDWALIDEFTLETRAQYLMAEEDFYGLGIESKVDDRVLLKLERILFQVGFFRSILDSFYIRLGWILNTFRLKESGGGVFLASNIIDRDRSTDMGPFAELGWDTRDSKRDPYEGGNVFLRGYFPTDGLGSERTFESWEAHSSYFVSPAYRHVLGIHLGFALVSASAPFARLHGLSEAVAVRGVRNGRFREHHALGTTLDYRGRMWGSISLITFGSLGRVAPSGQLLDTPFKFGVGGGLQFQFSQDRSQIGRVELGLFDGEFNAAISTGIDL